jgi:hypothetical protein
MNDSPRHSSAPRRNRRWGATVSVLVATIALAGIATIGVMSFPVHHPGKALFTPATNQELAITLSRLRLNPEPLAAAGLSAQQTTTLVGNLRSHLTSHMDDLRTADTDLGNASSAVDSLTRRVQAGLGSEQDVSDLATARTTLATARGNLSTLLAAALTAAVDGLGEGPVALLSTCRGNLDGVAGDTGVGGIPTQYLVSSRTESQWVGLRDALSNVRICTRLGQDPNPDAQSLIAAADAEGPTAAAITDLDANLQSVTAAWNAAVFPQ